MLKAEEIKGIITQYAKHGWILRRVLLSDGCPIDQNLIGGIVPQASEIDALWFSRSSIPGKTAWELRSLSDRPFALLTVLNDGEDMSDLSDTEHQMLSALSRQPISH